MTTRLLFSINAGRSGSHYLATLLDRVDAVYANHERPPFGNGAAMRQYLAGDRRAMDDVASRKAALMRHVVARGQVYAETSHTFIKGFGWLLPEFFPEDEIGVVWLTRDPEEIVESTMRVGSGPLTPIGREWLIPPSIPGMSSSAPRRVLPPRATYWAMLAAAAPWVRGARFLPRRWGDRPPRPEWIQGYERDVLRWYVREIEARGERFLRTHPDIRCYRTSAAKLNELDELVRLLDFFGIDPSGSVEDVVGRRTNDAPSF